jgi:hypothetical protein
MSLIVGSSKVIPLGDVLLSDTDSVTPSGFSTYLLTATGESGGGPASVHFAGKRLTPSRVVLALSAVPVFSLINRVN